MTAQAIDKAASASRRDEAIDLASGFFAELGEMTPVGYSDLPAEYQTLLAHSGHMTVTLEAWHESLVDVRVVAETTQDDRYARHSLLARQSDGRIVQSGVMRIDLAGLASEVRERVAAGGCPLGRILIRSNVLREVELLALWRITPATQLAEELAVPPGDVIYGRSARILVEGRPAVELLEIVQP
ncbi:MAG: hypothetical protein AAFV43_09255 [Planctomycetota bacterium]